MGISLGVICHRGYSITAAGPALRRLRKTVIQPIGRPRDEIQLTEFDHLCGSDISHISAPVFTPNGAVSLALMLTGMPMNLTGSGIAEYAERLRLSAATVTSETHGRPPK